MNQLLDKVEASLKQCLRDSSSAKDSETPTVQAQVLASVLTAFVAGRLQRFVRSGFKRLPSENLESSLRVMLG
jgi:TetR/AcrR family transcriptional regulator